MCNYTVKKRMNKKIKNALRQTLTVPEYVLKIASIPAGIIAAGSAGSALGKAVSGGSRVWTTPIDVVSNFRKLVEISHDYSVLTAREFTNKYGTEMGYYVVGILHGFIEWGSQFSHNVNNEPIETILAVIVITSLLYAGGRAIRFIRQKGQGSYLIKLERKIGQKYWPETKSEEIWAPERKHKV